MSDKIQRIYETENCVSIWTYDPKVSKVNPISVEHRWRNIKELLPPKKKTMKDMVPTKKKKK